MMKSHTTVRQEDATMKIGARFLLSAAALLAGSTLLATLMLDLTAWGADISYSGQVLKVDPAQHQMIVKNTQSGGRLKFTVTEGTAITSEGNKKSLGDIKSGEAVDIEYALEGGKYIAHKIMLKPSAEK
jgi:hypothetical protein